MEAEKRLIRVLIEKEIEVVFTESLLGGLTEEEYLAEFRKSLWHVESMDEVAEYAARMAATLGGGYSHDGLGLLDHHYSTYPRVPDVKFREVYSEVETEVLSTSGT